MRKHCQYTRILKTYREYPFPSHPFSCHHLPSSVGPSSLLDTLSADLSPGCGSTCLCSCTWEGLAGRLEFKASLPCMAGSRIAQATKHPFSNRQISNPFIKLSGWPCMWPSFPIRLFTAAASLSFALSHSTPTALPYLCHKLLFTKQVILGTIDQSSHLE